MGKMKDTSIELEDAGLDPSDNSNLQGYVDDTHHFGEDVLKLELQGTYGKHESDVGTDQNDGLLNIGQTDLTILGLATKNDDGSLNFDIESGGLFSRHTIVNGRQMGKSNERHKALMSIGPFHVDGNKHNFIHVNLTAPDGLWFNKRYSYSGRLAKGRLHYDVIDSHTREVVNTYRQIKKAKALVKELNRG